MSHGTPPGGPPAEPAEARLATRAARRAYDPPATGPRSSGHQGASHADAEDRLSVAALALAFSLSAQAADVTGQWTTEFNTQVGVQKYTFDLKAKGEELTGTAAFERMGEKGTAELKEGKVQGDKITFVEMLDFQGTAVRIEYTGQLAGDEIKFTRKVGEIATEELRREARRQVARPAGWSAGRRSTAAAWPDRGSAASFQRVRSSRRLLSRSASRSRLRPRELPPPSRAAESPRAASATGRPR